MNIVSKSAVFFGLIIAMPSFAGNLWESVLTCQSKDDLSESPFMLALPPVHASDNFSFYLYSADPTRAEYLVYDSKMTEPKGRGQAYGVNWKKVDGKVVTFNFRDDTATCCSGLSNSFSIAIDLQNPKGTNSAQIYGLQTFPGRQKEYTLISSNLTCKFGQ